jgi:hypothetical protein
MNIDLYRSVYVNTGSYLKSKLNFNLIVLYYIDCMMFYMLLYYCTVFCIDVFCSWEKKKIIKKKKKKNCHCKAIADITPPHHSGTSVFLAYLVPLDVDVTGNITTKICEAWSEFNIFCTLVTMATAAILNFFQLSKSCHSLPWIFLQSFMKFVCF